MCVCVYVREREREKSLRQLSPQKFIKIKSDEKSKEKLLFSKFTFIFNFSTKTENNSHRFQSEKDIGKFQISIFNLFPFYHYQLKNNHSNAPKAEHSDFERSVFKRSVPFGSFLALS